MIYKWKMIGDGIALGGRRCLRQTIGYIFGIDKFISHGQFMYI